MSDLSRIILVLLLVLGNAVFVAAEYALVTARRSRLEQQAERHATARVALRLMDEPSASSARSRWGSRSSASSSVPSASR